jgi:hypothetical protein
MGNNRILLFLIIANSPKTGYNISKEKPFGFPMLGLMETAVAGPFSASSTLLILNISIENKQ